MDCAGPAAALASAGGVARASDSGRMTSTITAKPTSVWCHPTVSMSTLAVGRNRNCPSEPAAVLAPNAMGRQLSGRSLPNTLMTRLPEQPGAEVDQHRRRPVRHEHQAERVQQAADAEDAHGAEAVGDGAGERLAHP